MTETTIPGGSNKGALVTDPSVPVTDLRYWAENARNADVRAACAAELQRRGANGAPSATQTTTSASTAVAPRRHGGTELVTGAYRDAHKATQALMRAQEVAHLVAPATVCATLPEGCEVALCAVLVDVKHETYELPGGKVGLGKTALDRIAAAAGVTWDPVHTRRLDDGSDPRYCHYVAVGAVRAFDGQLRTLSGEVEIDARDGSPQIEEIVKKAEAKKRDPSGQILELRKFILRHAESKAKNRAIRSLGLRTSYEAAELTKPFVVAKPMFTGYSDDPDARREFRAKIADSFLGASAALYGQPQPVAQTPQRLSAPQGHRPPPIEETGTEDDEGEWEHPRQNREADQPPFPPTEAPDCGCPNGPDNRHEPGCPQNAPRAAAGRRADQGSLY